MKRIATLVMTIVMTIFAVSTVFTVSAVGAADNTPIVAYDVNDDGIVDDMDFTIMRDSIMNEESAYRISDMVKLKKFISGVALGKAARGFNFKKIEVSEKSVNLIKNSLYDWELASIKYNAGEITIEDDYTYTVLIFNETTENPEKEDDVVTIIVVEGVEYVIWIDNGNFKISQRNTMLSKASKRFNFKKIEASEQSVNIIKTSLYDCELTSIKYNAGEIIIEDDYSITSLVFSETTENPEKEADVVITCVIEDIEYIIWIDNGSFKVSQS